MSHPAPSVALLIALLAGAALPLQAGANAELGRLIGHPLSAALVSTLIGLAAMLLIMLVSRAPAPSIAALAPAPWWSYIGGLMGVGFLVLAILSAPRLGAAAFIAIAVAGQMIVSVAIDHFALVGFSPRPVSWGRLLGLALIVMGVVLVQFAGRPQSE